MKQRVQIHKDVCGKTTTLNIHTSLRMGKQNKSLFIMERRLTAW